MLTFTHKHLHTFLITSNFLIPSLDATEDIGWGGAGWDVNVHTHTHTHTLAHMFVEYQFMVVRVLVA